MTIYDVGDRVHISTLVYNTTTGQPTDATVAVAVTKPDGTVGATVAGVNHDGVGQYSADIDATAAGNWAYAFTASGTVVGVDTGQFYVQPPGFRIVSLTDAKTHINKTSTFTGDDNELRGFIDTAGDLVEMLAGSTVNRTVIEYHDGGTPTIALDQWPVVSVTQVVETWGGGGNYTLGQVNLGGPSTGYDFTFDQQTGTITRRVNSNDYSFPAGTRNVKVTYIAGRPQPWPAAIRMAALEEIAYLWRTSQSGRSGGRPQPVTEVTVDVAGFGAVPVRVVSLLENLLPPQAGA